MYSQGRRRPSDLESMSSQTSDVTSRATTIPDSTSDSTLQHLLTEDNVNNQAEGENRTLTPATTTGSVDTVVSKKPDAQRSSNNQLNQATTGNQQQQQWVNPYWDSDGKSSSTGVQSKTNQSNNNINNG